MVFKEVETFMELEKFVLLPQQRTLMFTPALGPRTIFHEGK